MASYINGHCEQSEAIPCWVMRRFYCVKRDCFIACPTGAPRKDKTHFSPYESYFWDRTLVVVKFLASSSNKKSLIPIDINETRDEKVSS